LTLPKIRGAGPPCPLDPPLQTGRQIYHTMGSVTTPRVRNLIIYLCYLCFDTSGDQWAYKSSMIMPTLVRVPRYNHDCIMVNEPWLNYGWTMIVEPWFICHGQPCMNHGGIMVEPSYVPEPRFTTVEPWYHGRFCCGTPILVNLDYSPEVDKWFSKSGFRLKSLVYSNALYAAILPELHVVQWHKDIQQTYIRAADSNREWVSRGLTSHSTLYRSFGDDFYRPDDPTNSIKALNEASWPLR